MCNSKHKGLSRKYWSNICFSVSLFAMAHSPLVSEPFNIQLYPSIYLSILPHPLLSLWVKLAKTLIKRIKSNRLLLQCCQCYTSMETNPRSLKFPCFLAVGKTEAIFWKLIYMHRWTQEKVGEMVWAVWLLTVQST